MTFRRNLGMIKVIKIAQVRQCTVSFRMLANRKGWFIMKCLNKVLTIIGCITAAVAVVTAAFAVLNYFKEKKENAELEAYLEGSIQ